MEEVCFLNFFRTWKYNQARWRRSLYSHFYILFLEPLPVNLPQSEKFDNGGKLKVQNELISPLDVAWIIVLSGLT